MRQDGKPRDRTTMAARWGCSPMALALLLAGLGCGAEFGSGSTGGGGGSTATGTGGDGGTAAGAGDGGEGATSAGGNGGTAGQGGAITTACGNGIIERPETCDDQNDVDDDGCTNDCTFVCPDFGGVERGDTGHCYRAFEATLTWQAARTACRQLNGGAGFELVALSTIDEIVWVESQPALIGFGTYWTGGNDIQQVGVFEWSNGEPWTYTNNQEPWATASEPNGGTVENCVQAYDGLGGMGPTYVLNDVTCSWTESYICEWTPPVVDDVGR